MAIGPVERAFAKIISRAWNEPEFAAALENPSFVASLLKEFDLHELNGKQIFIHVETSTTRHFVIPPPPASLLETQVAAEKQAKRIAAGACSIGPSGPKPRRRRP